MKIYAHIKDQIYEVHCGLGRQKLQWLGDVAIHRYDHFTGKEAGLCKAVELEDGTLLDLSSIVADVLYEAAHVWVLLIEDELPKDDNKSFEVQDSQMVESSIGSYRRPATNAVGNRRRLS